jgi:hypothetical protein
MQQIPMQAYERINQCCGSGSESGSVESVWFWPHGSGSISQRYGSGQVSRHSGEDFRDQTKERNKFGEIITSFRRKKQNMFTGRRAARILKKLLQSS